jgi:outer membrane protein OmpA-like peptidoglycan-associated protein
MNGLAILLAAATGTATPVKPCPPAAPPLAELLFEFDSARLPAGSSQQLAGFARWARNHPGKIVIDGNADSTGPSAYNVGLSLRRAQAVRAQLVRLGVDHDRIFVVGYGEDGLRRTTDALDRRVNVWTSQEPLYAIIDRALVRGTAVVWDQPVTSAEVDGPRAPAVATR